MHHHSAHFRNSQLFICIIGFIFSLSSFASELPKSLNLVTGNDFKPWSDESLNQGGIITEIVQTTFKKSGIKTNLEWLPWKRAYRQVKTGHKKTYGAFPYSYSTNRVVDVHYSIPIVSSGLTIFVSDTSSVPTDYGEQSALYGLEFCTGLGYAFDDFDPLVNAGKITLKRLSDINSCFRQLKEHRTDAIVTNKHVGWGIIRSLYHDDIGFKSLKEHKPSIYHLIVNKDQPNSLDILNTFNKTLLTLQKNGTVKEIIDRHMKPAQ